jgi:hypothetical protein
MLFILDNILFIHETLEWAKHANQPLIGYSKAYDMVDF